MIVGEIIAALLGLIVALAAIALTVVTGNTRWDAIGTVAIGVLLIVIAVLAAIEIKTTVIGQSADLARERELCALLEAQPGITRVLSLITL